MKTTAWQILLWNALQTLRMPLFEKWALTTMIHDIKKNMTMVLHFKYICFPANTKHLYNNCTTSANVFDVGPTLYKCYTNVLCLLGCHVERMRYKPHKSAQSLWFGLVSHTTWSSEATRKARTRPPVAPWSGMWRLSVIGEGWKRRGCSPSGQEVGVVTSRFWFDACVVAAMVIMKTPNTNTTLQQSCISSDANQIVSHSFVNCMQ